MKLKLESYGHQEFNTVEVKSEIEKRITKNQDFIGRKFSFWLEENKLPKYLIKNKEKYRKMFK